jgi:hypothetical protein
LIDKIAFLSFGLMLAACVPEPFVQQPAAEGTTANGETVYAFTLTRTSALGVVPVSDKAISARANGLCPSGYRELSRYGEAQRRISGVIYTDVTVRIVCS